MQQTKVNSRDTHLKAANGSIFNFETEVKTYKWKFLVAKEQSHKGQFMATFHFL